MNDHPLISCLCVTRNKVNMLKRSVACFQAQTYPNKELILLYENDDPDTKALAESVAGGNIIAVETASVPKLTLGELRNLSIEKATGEYFCQWDDDDWYHNRRIELQWNALRQSRKAASILSNWIIFDQLKSEAYFSFHKMWEGSLICRKDIISEDLKYPSLSKGEDSQFLYKLLMANHLYPTVMPALYIYVYHGNNTWESSHFDTLFTASQKLAPATGELIKQILEDKYTPEQASELLFSPETLAQIDYFHSYKKY